MAHRSPGHSAKSAGARIHLNTHTPFRLYPSKFEWANYAAVRAECWNLSGNVLTRNMSGNTRSQVSQFAEPLSTDPGIKSGISVCELISTSKKQTNKTQAGNEWWNISPKFSQVRNKPSPPQQLQCLCECLHAELF